LAAKDRLKSRILRMLKEDEEFRYAVAGLIGLEEILKRLDRHEEEIARLREDMVKLREDMMKMFEKHEERFARIEQELVRLREDMMKGFDLVNRHISAIGARWGIMTEDAFREGLRGILEKEFGVKVERWVTKDEDGIFYGFGSVIEIGVAVKDGKTMLIEISSHMGLSDVAAFLRKAKLYERKTGIKPDRLIMVTPYAEDIAIKAAKEVGVEVYTRV